MVNEGFENQLQALIADSIELHTEGEQVRLLSQKISELFDGLIIKLVVVEIDLLKQSAVTECSRDLFEACVSNAVVLNRELNQIDLSLQAVLCKLTSS